MYKGASWGLQYRTDKGISQKTVRIKRAKTGKPKSKVHVKLEASAIGAQRASWLRYIANCKENGIAASLICSRQ